MPAHRTEKQMELSHLRRDVKTALELALVALAPSELVDELAAVAGLLEAISELPVDGPPSIVLLPKVLARAKSGLDGWQSWEKTHEKPSA